MTERMGKLRRMLRLVHLLADTTEGLTLDEMADELAVNRRTAERMRDVIDGEFELEILTDERRKRFRIPEGLRRIYTRPSAAEVAALQTEVTTLKRRRAAHAEQLESLLGKVKSAFDDREKRRLDPDLEALGMLQRGMFVAGPTVVVEPATVAEIQGAILSGCCLEFGYRAEGARESHWRRVIPYGLIHGSVPYLVGKMPSREDPPILFRLDRMSEVRTSKQTGCAPHGWDLDEWMARSFGVWREKAYDVELLVLPGAAERARNWSFHPAQSVEERADGSIAVTFSTGGLREIAEHLFTWGGDLRIIGPAELRAVMAERLSAASLSLGGADA